MVTLAGKALRRLITMTVLSLTIILITLRFSYTDNFILASELSKSINIITKCDTNPFKPFNDPHLAFDSKIPNVIHQIWKTNNVRTYSREIEASLDLWKNMFGPLNYTVKLWTDDAILQLVKTNYPWILTTYESYPQNIQRADIARLLIIHAEGGIYADLDVYPTSPHQIQCLQHLGLQAVFASTARTLGLSNHFFMAERGSPFLQWVLYEAKRRGGVKSQHISLPYLQVFWSTGPTMVTAAFRSYAWIYGTLWYDMGLLENGYSRVAIRHAAGRSWHKLDGQALNYIADHLRIGVLLGGIAFLFLVLGIVYIARRHLL
ncbi:uncharacterized protein N7503_009375 [Penicillium pulvis]|uniref:uncharacterized protein n=1 Tax=Penicillium pulvis TaxID=1562058 RepID=UPI002548FE8F|nr:uncharacterized protein N7503_009375 [Penicillium pulvis]KAJ5793397.1 hypothetical protein N7503_009375 [Penicillium pulvis]